MKKSIVSEEYKCKEMFYLGRYLKITLYYTTGTKKEAKGYYMTFQWYIGTDITACLHGIKVRVIESGARTIKHKEQACIMFDNVAANIDKFLPYLQSHYNEKIEFENLYLDVLY